MTLIDTFSNRLQKALDYSNMKQVDLVRKTSLDKTLINKYLAGVMKAKQDKLTILADALNVNEVWLMGYDVPMERDLNKYSYESKHILNLTEKSEEYFSNSFPHLGKVKAGYDYLASENIIGYVYADKKVSDPENYFALTITGDSMQPILYEDDIIIVHRQNDIENGQIGIILIDNEEATIKKIIKHENFIELVAFNSYYPPKRLEKNSNFQIIGKVTEARISKIFE